MIQLRKSEDRGYANHGWLKSFHTFSFANYHDPDHMGFLSLRVINEDRIDGGSGFGKHPHRDMEIISYVVSGALRHEDTMGNKTVIRPGEVQTMSAGSGIFHSEMNDGEMETAHFFQIWILPNAVGGKPGYGQKSFANEIETKAKVLVVSQDGREGSIAIKQDADIYVSRLKPQTTVDFEIRKQRGIWVQVVSGDVTIEAGGGRHSLKAGDALSSLPQKSVASLASPEGLLIKSEGDSEVLVFDLLDL